MSNKRKKIVDLALTLEEAKLLLELIGNPLDGQCYHIGKKDKEFGILESIQSELKTEYDKKKVPFSHPYTARMYKENDLTFEEEKNISLESRVEVLELIARELVFPLTFAGTFQQRAYHKSLLARLPEQDWQKPTQNLQPPLDFCKWCNEGDKPEMLDEDGVKCSISGQKGFLHHAADDAYWLCTNKEQSQKNDCC